MICTFILSPVSLILGTKQASAQMAVFDAAVESAIIAGNGISTSALAKEGLSALFSELIFGSIDGLTVKETVLDGIAWGLINLVLEEMIKSTTRWVNSGFQGSPAFVTDLNGYLRNIADQIAGEIIWGAGLGFLCSPFKLDVQLALELQYQSSQEFQAQCTLSSVVDNMEGFFNGDFLAGGWDGWFEMSLDPQNNPYGAMLEGQAAIGASIQNAQGESIEILNWGRGFLSMEDCEVTGLDSDGGEVTQCSMVTPGAVIETQLNATLNIPQGRLTVADEINELVGALFTQLTKEVFSGAGGLLGLTEPRYGSRGDYYTRSGNQQATQINPLSTVSTGNSFDVAIENESKYYNWVFAFAALIRNHAGEYKNTKYGATATCHSGALTSSLRNQLTNYAAAASSSLATIGIVQTLKADYVSLQTPGTAQTAVSAVLSKYGAASIPQAQGIIMGQFGSLQTSGALHGAGISVTHELQTYPGLQTEVQTFTNGIDTACRSNRSRR